MAQLSSNFKAQATGSVAPRIKSAVTVDEAKHAARTRAFLYTWVQESDVVARRHVKGIVLQGALALKDENILTGASGTGKPHVSLRCQYALLPWNDATKRFFTEAEVIANFNSSLVALTTKDEVEKAWYAFQDAHVLHATSWQGDPAWESIRQAGQSFTGYLNSREYTTKDGEIKVEAFISITGVEKPENPLRPKNRTTVAETAPSAPATAPAPSAPAPAVPVMAGPPAPSMKVHPSDGKAYTPDQLRAGGWSDAQIAGLADA